MTSNEPLTEEELELRTAMLRAIGKHLNKPEINAVSFLSAASACFKIYKDQERNYLEQVIELRKWKVEQIETFLPLMEFMHKRTELQAGESITKKAIQYIEERDGLNAICEESINLLNRIITIHRVGEIFESQAKTLINKYNEEFGR